MFKENIFLFDKNVFLNEYSKMFKISIYFNKFNINILQRKAKQKHYNNSSNKKEQILRIKRKIRSEY